MMGIISMMGILGISMMGGQVTEQATQLPSDSQASSFSRDIALRQRTESDQATAQAHAQVKQAVEATAPQARQSLEKEQRPEALAKEARAEELQQSLQQERQRAAGLASELAAARGELDKVASSRKSDDEAARRGQAAEAAAEELKQSLQQERQRAAGLTPDLESTQGMPEARMTQERPASSLPSETTSVAESAPAERPAAAGAKVDPEAARLTARASILLAQGNIGAARLVLERAAEMGSAKASFALAETYDPRILSSWGAYGTRGDAAKAREFYAKAAVGGISEAEDRFNALR
jgi:hypothetical protein